MNESYIKSQWMALVVRMLVSQVPKDAHFVIMSDDQDLDHVVKLLKSQHRSAERVGMRKEEQQPVKVVPLTEPKVAVNISPLVKMYCAHLITYKKNRPAKNTTLLNSVANKLGDEKSKAAEVLEALLKAKALQVKDTKVHYFDDRIVELAR